MSSYLFLFLLIFYVIFFNFYNVHLVFAIQMYKAAIIIHISSSSQAPQIPFFLNPRQLLLVNNLYSLCFFCLDFWGKLSPFSLFLAT